MTLKQYLDKHKHYQVCIELRGEIAMIRSQDEPIIYTETALRKDGYPLNQQLIAGIAQTLTQNICSAMGTGFSIQLPFIISFYKDNNIYMLSVIARDLDNTLEYGYPIVPVYQEAISTELLGTSIRQISYKDEPQDKPKQVPAHWRYL